MTSRTANQTKTEPFPASSTESEAETPGSDHPQTPTGTTEAGGDVGDAATVPVVSEEKAAGTSEESPVVQGLHTPEVDQPEPRT